MKPSGSHTLRQCDALCSSPGLLLSNIGTWGDSRYLVHVLSLVEAVSTLFAQCLQTGPVILDLVDAGLDLGRSKVVLGYEVFTHLDVGHQLGMTTYQLVLLSLTAK